MRIFLLLLLAAVVSVPVEIWADNPAEDGFIQMQIRSGSMYCSDAANAMRRAGELKLSAATVARLKWYLNECREGRGGPKIWYR